MGKRLYFSSVRCHQLIFVLCDRWEPLLYIITDSSNAECDMNQARWIRQSALEIAENRACVEWIWLFPDWTSYKIHQVSKIVIQVKDGQYILFNLHLSHDSYSNIVCKNVWYVNMDTAMSCCTYDICVMLSIIAWPWSWWAGHHSH